MTHTHQRFLAGDQEREPYRADCPACNPDQIAKAGDCPTCRYHPHYQGAETIGALCRHPRGELYRAEFDAMHLVTICAGWKEASP